MEFEYAFLLDALLEEQEQNITIDTTQIQFKTAKRPYVIIDAPGHKEFLKNMITGAASADAAVLLIAANEGVREQSRRHGYLLSLLGIKQVVVAVNKMDLVGLQRADLQRRGRGIPRRSLTQIGLEARTFVPISARNGYNVASRSPEVMPWYDGPSITEMLDQFEPPKQLTELPLRFPVQDVYRFDDRRIIAGRIESGSLKVGDEIVFSPNNKTSVVASIERWEAPAATYASAGESIGITLTEQIFVERGHVASHAAHAPIESNRFRARLFWMGRSNLDPGQRYKLKLATQELDAEIVSVDRIIDASTLETVTEGRTHIARNDVAEVVIQTRGALVMDNHDQNPILGRFVIVDDRHVSGGGIIFGGIYTRPGHGSRARTSSGRKATSPPRHRIAAQRASGAVVWLTGLSGAGKSTIAQALERELFNRNMQCLRPGRRQRPPRPELQPRLLARGPRGKHPARGGSGEPDGRQRPGRGHRVHLALPLGPPARAGDRARRRVRFRRGLRGRPARGLRAARPEALLQKGARGRDQGIHRHRRPLRSAGRPGDRHTDGRCDAWRNR